jgi:hypothetical protein
LYSSKNVHSVVRNGSGIFWVNLDYELPDTEYTVVATCSITTTDSRGRWIGVANFGVNTFEVEMQSSGSASTDYVGNVAVFR